MSLRCKTDSGVSLVHNSSARPEVQSTDRDLCHVPPGLEQERKCVTVTTSKETLNVDILCANGVLGVLVFV